MLTAVETRLQGVANIHHVGGALDLAKLMGKPPKADSLFVVPLGDKPRPTQRDIGPPLQNMVETFAVVTAFRSTGDMTGMQGNAKLDAVKAEVRTLLHGWVPAAGYDPITLGNRGLRGIKDGFVWYQMDFQTTTYHEGNPQ